ncbi:MAG TPA: hypothetical protein VJ872_02460 [Nocardioides sp.]|nr:hypothetical protein [Nocardioides sp.]
MHKVVVALVLTLAGLVTMSPTSPAAAATTSSAHAALTTRGAYVAPRACGHSHAGFKLDVDWASITDFRAWSANVTINGPGRYHDSAVLDWYANNDQWQSTFFCGSPNRAGTYTVRVRLDITHDTSYVGTHTYESLSTTFRIRTAR